MVIINCLSFFILCPDHREKLVLENNCYVLTLFLFHLIALQKAGKHMEDSLVASYAALLLGLLAENNKVSISKGVDLRPILIKIVRIVKCLARVDKDVISKL